MSFARPFRVHPRSGPALDGAAFPSGRAVVLDDPEYGLATVAISIEELLRGGYHGARIEWADQVPAEHCGHQPPNRISGYGVLTECVLRPDHSGSHADEHGMRWWLATTDPAVAEEQPADLTERPEDTVRRFARRLVAVEQLCSGRPGYHTVTVKELLTAMGDDDLERLGCTGPDPTTP